MFILLLAFLIEAQQPTPVRVFQSMSQLRYVCLTDAEDPDAGGKLAACAGYVMGVVDSWLLIRSAADGVRPCLSALPDKLDLTVSMKVALARTDPAGLDKRSAALFVLNTFLEEYPECAAGQSK